MKKIISVILVFALCFSFTSLFACGADETLNVYNCYDYIDEELIDAFEDYYKEKTGKSVEVKYSCFDTPEDAYNNLKIDPNAYDLICPSDYMIEKMAREGLLQKIDMDKDGNYEKYVSSYIKDVFESISWGANESLANYAVGYMWGTLGLVYNPAKIDRDDMNSWSTLWTGKYKGQYSVKDSVRDTYFMSLAKHYERELTEAKQKFEEDGDLQAYQTLLKGYFNNTSASTISSVKNILINLGKNCKNLEVDEGKEDITKGLIDIGIAWSGDAVYALDLADENGLTLEYYVPDEGSNIWFDGWVVPKNSKKLDLAKEFLDFISTPSNVVKNMEYIGYTSVIAGNEVFDYVKDSYDEGEGEETDLSYFFGEGDYKIKTTEERRQFYTQYPTEDVINRCVVMNYFPTEANKSINEMWIEVKSNLG